MLSPIEQLVELSGEPGVIKHPAPANYDPASTTDWVPGTPVMTTVNGVWHDGIQEGIDAGLVGMFLIDTVAGCPCGTPSALQASKSRILIHGIDYLIMKVRTRTYRGETDGYELWVAE